MAQNYNDWWNENYGTARKQTTSGGTTYSTAAQTGTDGTQSYADWYNEYMKSGGGQYGYSQEYVDEYWKWMQQMLSGQQQVEATKAKYAGEKELSQYKWDRIMAALEEQGLLSPETAGQLSAQTASRRAEPALRGYQQRKREIANTMQARGMGLSSAADMAESQAYSDLARSLAEAGTYGDIAAYTQLYNLYAALAGL